MGALGFFAGLTDPLLVYPVSLVSLLPTVCAGTFPKCIASDPLMLPLARVLCALRLLLRPCGVLA